MGLARHEGEFKASGKAKLDPDELFGALRGPAIGKSASRCDAIARCLSGNDGWRDAAASLGGAFATLAKPTGLTDGKES